MFEWDISLCWNADDCPKKDTCERAIKLVGIHTYSSFYEEGKDCEYYLEKEMEVK